MSGKRWGIFRGGDRSEYLAAFGLSRVAFVSPIPRQEEFGVVDFLCVLTQNKDKLVYPESAFYVQVKSSRRDFEYDADSIRWISQHMDHPLLVCHADKDKSELTFYSLSRIWFALFLCAEPKTIKLKFDSDNPQQPWILTEKDGEAHFEVLLGPPILRQNLSELEEDASLAFSILDAWIRVDAANIARRHLGRLAVRCFWEWQPNKVPASQFLNRYYHGPGYRDAEPELAFLLTAFGTSYERFGQSAKLRPLRELLKALGPYLDDTGKEISNHADDSAE